MATLENTMRKRDRALSRQQNFKWPTHDRRFVDLRFLETRAAILLKEPDILEEVFVDFESSIPSWDIYVVRKFFRTYARNVTGTQQQQARAKLDARGLVRGTKRRCPEWLTPSDLYRYLNEKRFEHERPVIGPLEDESEGWLEAPAAGQSRDQSEEQSGVQSKALKFLDVDRQIVYIYRLCPQYILALLQTAYYHQQAALREAIWKHIAGEALVRVQAPIDNFTTFHLEFHMPFLTLRECILRGRTSDGSPDDAWPEMASLNIECHEHMRTCKYVIREAHVSVVICGWSHSKWVCWGFSNTHLDPTTRNEEPSEEFDIYQEDYVSTDGEGPADGRTINLEQPIWCARRYWLQTVDIRMQIVHKEWTWLVRSTEADIKAWVSKNRFFSTKDLETTQHNRLGELLDRAVEKIELLRKLNENLGNSIRAWDRFNGDRNCFSDLQEASAISALTSHKRILECLVDLKRKLQTLEKTCEKAEKILTLSMGKKINNESQALSLRSHAVNLEKITITQETAKLNRQSTAAAVESSRTTRINMQMFLITTPVILALQYFGAEKDIFSFERNPKTFSYTVCVLFFALPILTYALSLLNRTWDNLIRRIFGKTGPEDKEGAVIV
ncbi:uncharacterized protein EKO05_0008363 [Ascochyta rabiei]|uniref:uncharacterized protein n=1 Tax=Didymella rabiei TaxID=5454 RepID=UPI0021FD1EC6|nr:uncharacterized protein EKO05_0008363 [Ascochyta rabiei]UPX18040.1 hypothetical protein EKO05_0008363 [Ascochyta rabiei]